MGRDTESGPCLQTARASSNRVPRIELGVGGIKGSGSMRKRVVRALIFLIIAVTGAVGAASVAGAFDGSPPSGDISSTDGLSWD